MRLRTKLAGAFLLITLLIFVLGGIAVQQVDGINGKVRALSADSLPTLAAVYELERLHQEQRFAALAYFTSGRAEDRQRYTERAQEFGRQLTALPAHGENNDRAGATAVSQLVWQVAEDHARFSTAADRLLSSRATVDAGLTDLRRWNDAISAELSAIVQARAPVNRRPIDRGMAVEAEGRENSELIAAVEGMRSITSLAQSQVVDYLIRQDPALKAQFAETSGIFGEWLAAARVAGNASDRAMLVRVETQFQQFEAAAKTMLIAADLTTQAHDAFIEAGNGLATRLSELATQASADTDAARQRAASTTSRTRGVLAMLTLIAAAVTGFGGVGLAYAFTRPLSHLRDVAKRISQGDLVTIDIPIEARDEIGDLARAFRRMSVSLRILMPEESAEDPISIGRA